MYVISLITEGNVVKGKKYRVVAESGTYAGMVYVVDDEAEEECPSPLEVGEWVEVEEEEPSYKEAYLEFSRKTEWLTKTVTTGELGKHHADILCERIEALQEENAELKFRLDSLEK